MVLKLGQVPGLHVEEVGQLVVIDPVLAISTKGKVDVLRAQASNLRAIVIAAPIATAELFGPLSRSLLVLARSDQISIAEFPIDKLPTHAEALCQALSRSSIRRQIGDRFVKPISRHHCPCRHAVADDLGPPVFPRKAIDEFVACRIDAAGSEEKMRQFVEQREDLPGLRRRIIDINDRELVVIQAEPGIARLSELVFISWLRYRSNGGSHGFLRWPVDRSPR